MKFVKLFLLPILEILSRSICLSNAIFNICFCCRAPVVGWPPIKSFRKNTLATNTCKNTDVVETDSITGCIYVKVSMDGAPYLRKVDLKTYCSYTELSSALESMFSCFTIGKHFLSCCLSRSDEKLYVQLVDIHMLIVIVVYLC